MEGLDLLTDKLGGRTSIRGIRLGDGLNPRHLHISWVPGLNDGQTLRGERGTVSGEPGVEAVLGRTALGPSQPGLGPCLPVESVRLCDAAE